MGKILCWVGCGLLSYWTWFGSVVNESTVFYLLLNVCFGTIALIYSLVVHSIAWLLALIFIILLFFVAKAVWDR